MRCDVVNFRSIDLIKLTFHDGEQLIARFLDEPDPIKIDLWYTLHTTHCVYVARFLGALTVVGLDCFVWQSSALLPRGALICRHPVYLVYL